MKKKVLTVLLTGAMVASMAAGATVVSAEDNDNTLTVWAWTRTSISSPCRSQLISMQLIMKAFQ